MELLFGVLLGVRKSGYGASGFPEMTKEKVVQNGKVGHPNGAPQIPPLRFAPVGMTNRRGLLKGKGQLLGAGCMKFVEPIGLNRKFGAMGHPSGD
ncbi:MAG: hypothetical protein QOJ51_3365 [Acidobacteriaceae bacterium]|nr:hypothetical protein [Acidobacteriaceae bacterium]